MHGIYADELERLDAYARQQRDQHPDQPDQPA
jgi:hypothetical protein